MGEFATSPLPLWTTVSRQAGQLTDAERCEVVTIMESLKAGGWGYQAASERAARDTGLSQTVIIREMRGIQWRVEEVTARTGGRGYKAMIDWCVENRITTDQWADVQDRYGCTRSTCRDAIKAALKRIERKEQGTVSSDSPGFLPLAAEWLRMPRRRYHPELRQAIVDLYRDRGPTYYAGRP